MINVTKTYLPPFEEYAKILKRAWDKSWLTNNGELVQELEAKLKKYLGVQNLLFTANGTLPIQMALKALGITKEIITTPFSYVATTNVILWEGCKPIFVDIDPISMCIDATKIEAAITPETEAILATHVYGIPCDVDAIAIVAKKHNLKVIYDGAHAFGVTYKGKSLLSYGDISTCSFHATKVFHTIEGGCVICTDDKISNQLMLYRQFGHVGDEYYSMGINAKNSELHAAMGLCLLPQIEEIIVDRKRIATLYDTLLPSHILKSKDDIDFEYNYGYYPVFFENESKLLEIVSALKVAGISGRRYFNPSLNELAFIAHQSSPVSEDISRRVLCLPLYVGLSNEEVETIAGIINKILLLC